jgi:L-cysteine desulfidase
MDKIMQKYKTLIEILHKEIILALGCTEPVAVALASAWATKATGGFPEAINVYVDKNIYKNGLGVGVPGTGEVGLYIAAAIGAIGGDPALRLEVLKPITHDDVQKAKQLIADKKVSVEIQPDAHEVYVDIIVKTNAGEGRASIRGRHDNVTAVSCDGKPFDVFKEIEDTGVTESVPVDTSSPAIQQFTMKALFDFAESVPIEEIDFLRPVVETNRVFAERSMEQRGMVGVGSKIQRLISKGLMSDDFVGKTKRMVASAVEARMEGFNMAVMSCAGSGNQGLISTLPVLVAAEYEQVSEEQVLRAAAFSYLVTVYVKSYMGVLTPVCGGNVASGMGACCAITYLFGGAFSDIVRAVKNMAGSVMGVICDGAKIGCTLKSTMAVGVAVDSALLALEGVTVPTGDGIVEDSVDQTIRNMGFVTNPGMAQTDDAIIEVMTHQHH